MDWLLFIFFSFSFSEYRVVTQNEIIALACFFLKRYLEYFWKAFPSINHWIILESAFNHIFVQFQVGALKFKFTHF